MAFTPRNSQPKFQPRAQAPAQSRPVPAAPAPAQAGVNTGEKKGKKPVELVKMRVPEGEAKPLSKSGRELSYVKVGAIFETHKTQVNRETGQEEQVTLRSLILDEGVPTGVFLQIFPNDAK